MLFLCFGGKILFDGVFKSTDGADRECEEAEKELEEDEERRNKRRVKLEVEEKDEEAVRDGGGGGGGGGYLTDPNSSEFNLLSSSRLSLR